MEAEGVTGETVEIVNMRSHWYKITVFYCPLCGQDRTFRERQYGPKPEERNLRYRVREVYDWCDV